MGSGLGTPNRGTLFGAYLGNGNYNGISKSLKRPSSRALVNCQAVVWYGEKAECVEVVEGGETNVGF